MTERGSTGEYVVECFWPGVDADAVRALDARAAASADELTRAGTPVRYLGSLLMRADEVVLCLFEGAEPVGPAGRRAGRGAFRADPRGRPLSVADRP